MAAQWRELVTTAMLGTDRRDPPPPEGPLADLVDDTLRASPSERMLAQVAACTAVQRAGVQPAPPVHRLVGPAGDDRPTIVPAAVDRWHHITVSWPVLEDEWTLTVITNGWRIAPELVPVILRRHRRDPVRRARAELACGPLATWLVDLVDDLAAPQSRSAASPELIGELPELPIPLELEALLHAPTPEAARAISAGIDDGRWAAAHRAVLVNLIARVRRDGLADIVSALDAIESHSAGYGLASVLADLGRTRERMLDELVVG